jgi:L-cysteine:1D-myo-inositol 2-amino-2-deoxy-alpha-D-glucopyranoside ligase
VCGITPYDTTHLGHAFTYTSADILVRYLESQGYKVNYVQNVTDIDDDILRKAKEVSQDWQELGNRWTTHFIEDMKILNVRPPDHFPRATDVIPEMIAIVQKLLAVGVAYEAGGSVYFDISAWPDYGKLSELPQAEMLPVANERGNNPDDPHKQHPLDFVLWQAQSPGEPAWNSPWGLGRPGWHIECSTMATHFLGDTIDIHCGGADLVFPHHESEMAQVEPIIIKKPFARFWMHTAMVHHGAEKMSKSLGNLVMVRNLLGAWPPDALRLYLGMHHYRKPWKHDTDKLERAAQLAGKLRSVGTISGGNGALLDPGPAQDAFKQAMNNDLNTPEAITIMNNLADDVISAAENGRQIEMTQQVLRTMGQVFGLRLDDRQDERVLSGWNKHLERFKVVQVVQDELTQESIYG